MRWDPDGRHDRLGGPAGVDGAVHLAGAGVGDHRWTDDYKRTIRDSRVDGTRTLVTALAALDPLPRVLVSGSAVGYYGDRGDEELTEDVRRRQRVPRRRRPGVGGGDRAGARPPASGSRTIRTGLVLAPSGGALRPCCFL